MNSELLKIFDTCKIITENNKYIIYSSYFMPLLSFDYNNKINKITNILFIPNKYSELFIVFNFLDYIYYNSLIPHNITIDIINIDNIETLKTFDNFISSSFYFKYIYITSSFEFIHTKINLLNINPIIENIFILPSLSIDNIIFTNNITNTKITYYNHNDNFFILFSVIIIINFSFLLFIL
jgi:hypothetical protein